MKKAKISLLPFIESDKDGFLLDIPVLDQNGAYSQGYSSPFYIMDKGQNFSTIVKGGLKVKNSDPFKPLFLLVQRDHYPLVPDELTFFTNTGIDRIWYETIRSYSVNKNVFILPEQLDRDGRATPFSPLFFCQKEKKFFHPPCPECGKELDLCKDDGLLVKAGLPPYSTSLKRYLFCPDCNALRGRYDFYQFSRSAEDRSFIKDRFDLVKNFNKLRSNPVSGGFPCLDCPGYADCYITGEKATVYISFFSFYPFHMLFFDAEPIKAIDFIPFLSGANIGEATSRFSALSVDAWKDAFNSREGDHFFFKDEKKFYLEVLFLKLSFFEKFTRSLNQKAGKEIYPMSDMSIQSIWIRPGTSGNILPFFWNFNVSIIDLISNSPKNYIQSIFIKNSNLYFMASLWFYIFLVNKNQTQETVYNEIGTFARNKIKDSFSEDYDQLVEALPSAAMENVFWNPDLREVPREWYKIWKKILLTGFGFFDTGKDQNLKYDLKKLIIRIEDMKQEIKKELFSKDMAGEPMVQPLVKSAKEKKSQVNRSETQSSAKNQAIFLILKKLKARLADQYEKVPAPDDDVLETVVLSSRETGTSVDDALEKTMMMPGVEQEPVVQNTLDDMDKTVVISPPGNTHQDAYSSDGKEDIENNADDDLEKTVVITPKK